MSGSADVDWMRWSQQEEEDEENDDDEEFGVVHCHGADEEEEEEGFVDTGGIDGEEDEGNEDGDMALQIATEEEGAVEGVVRKALQFDDEPSAKKTKFMEAQPDSLKNVMKDHHTDAADDPDADNEQNAAEQNGPEPDAEPEADDELYDDQYSLDDESEADTVERNNGPPKPDAEPEADD